MVRAILYLRRGALMKILGIESSCDETAISFIEEKDGQFLVLKSLLATQIAIHAKYGGVVPEVAAREHIAAIFPMLMESGISRDGNEVDAIAVTAGPGLVSALRIGVELAKTLAYVWQKPLVAVNHLEGHIYSVWGNNPQPQFPALCLLVSGGHTELLLMKDHGQYEMIGMTRDDAAGEAFDKVAKLMGLSYPGGPAVSQMAKQGNAEAINFPRPMRESGDFDFSFSGLKTAVRNYLEITPEYSIPDVCASFQKAVTDILVEKSISAVKKYYPRSVILSGGVSANRALRDALQTALQTSYPSITFHAPDLSLTGDNATMIAFAGAMRAQKKDFTDPLILQANPNMQLV